MELSQQTGIQYDTNLRHFRLLEEETGKDLSRAARIEWIIQKLAGILNLPEEKEKQAKQLYDNVHDQQFDEVALAASLLWIASNRDPMRPRWKHLVADACMQLCKEENRIAHSYNRGYWRDEVRTSTKRLKEQGLEVDQANGVDYMWSVLSMYNPDNIDTDTLWDIRTFCMKLMPTLEHSPSYIEDGRDYTSKKRIGLAAALLYLGVKRYRKNTAHYLDLEELCEQLCRDPDRVENYVEMIVDDIFGGQMP